MKLSTTLGSTFREERNTANNEVTEHQLTYSMQSYTACLTADASVCVPIWGQLPQCYQL